MAVLAVFLTAVAAPMLGLSSANTGAARAANAYVSPNTVGGLDCNGLSPIQHPVKARRSVRRAALESDEGQFQDNGRYIRHSRPSVRFLSDQPGFVKQQLDDANACRCDPKALPTKTCPRQATW